MSDAALLRGSQAAHTQPICHGHAQGLKQPAKNIQGSGHVTPREKIPGGADPQKAFSRPWETPCGLSPQPRCARPRPNHTPYPCQSSQRQRPRFHHRNGARRSPNRRCVCGLQLRPNNPLDSLAHRCPQQRHGAGRDCWHWPHTDAPQPVMQCAGGCRLPAAARARPRKRREPCTGMQKNKIIDGPKSTARPPPAALRGVPPRPHQVHCTYHPRGHRQR